MIIFSFEVDTLEIALKEQQDMVDKIFIVESSATHKGVGNNIIGQTRSSPDQTLKKIWFYIFYTSAVVKVTWKATATF